MRTLLALCIALGLCDEASAQQQACAPYELTVRHLAETYGEALVAQGATPEGRAVAIFAGPGGSFTIIVRIGDQACQIAAGDGFEAVVAEAGGRGA